MSIEWLSIGDAAKELDLPQSALVRAVHAGELKTIGRLMSICRDDLDAWTAARASKASSPRVLNGNATEKVQQIRDEITSNREKLKAAHKELDDLEEALAAKGKDSPMSEVILGMAKSVIQEAEQKLNRCEQGLNRKLQKAVADTLQKPVGEQNPKPENSEPLLPSPRKAMDFRLRF